MCLNLKISVSVLPAWSRNSHSKNMTCLRITSAMDNCDRVKTGHLMVDLSAKLVPVFQSRMFSQWLIIKKKSGNDKASWKY